MWYLIYKKVKKQKKLLLLTASFPLVSALFISCFQPYQEIQKSISKSLVPVSKNTEEKNIPSPSWNSLDSTIQENSEIITNSVLGFNGQKKNPTSPKNQFELDKNYTEEIPNASFLPENGGTGRYGLLPYWYFFRSIPKYLENKGFSSYQYNRDEYVKRLDYFYEKLREYLSRNFPGGLNDQVDIWKEMLTSEYKKSMKFMGADPVKSFPEDLGENDKISWNNIYTDEFFPLIKPELERNGVKTDQLDENQKKLITFDFLLANERIWPSSVDEWGKFKKNDWKNDVRYFRDDYYYKKNYQPSNIEKTWYELGWFFLRVQRIYTGIKSARNVLENIWNFEKNLFELNDNTKTFDQQSKVKIQNSVELIVNSLSNFFLPHNHLNLRSDLVFNIDSSNNQDDQSLISDLILYYNEKVAPIIWRINSKRKDKKIATLTEELKDLHSDYYFNTYLAPLLPKIEDLPTEEDAQIDKKYSEDLQEKARQGAKKAGKKAWGIWLKNYQEKYGITFKADPEIDNEDFDESSLSVPKPIENITPNNTESKNKEIQKS
ncbi:hypothetical protein [Mesomycoplasma hyopneumoniae]|uniref:hypothetical protein n=1 Tax=Mesomycoplasma hyopneumoniae TaxID=2099 RepID=UPI001082F37E|nr:hypothetical protein E5E95_01725 [Mesomycoplasma hyopneumoniae]